MKMRKRKRMKEKREKEMREKRREEVIYAIEPLERRKFEEERMEVPMPVIHIG